MEFWGKAWKIHGGDEVTDEKHLAAWLSLVQKVMVTSEALTHLQMVLLERAQFVLRVLHSCKVRKEMVFKFCLVKILISLFKGNGCCSSFGSFECSC